MTMRMPRTVYTKAWVEANEEAMKRIRKIETEMWEEAERREMYFNESGMAQEDDFDNEYYERTQQLQDEAARLEDAIDIINRYTKGETS